MGFLGVGFLGGCTQKNPPGFFGYVPGCLNPANRSWSTTDPQLSYSLDCLFQPGFISQYLGVSWIRHQLLGPSVQVDDWEMWWSAPANAVECTAQNHGVCHQLCLWWSTTMRPVYCWPTLIINLIALKTERDRLCRRSSSTLSVIWDK